MDLSKEERLALDTLDVALRLSPMSGDAAFLRDWASSLIDQGFVGANTSTLWLEAESVYTTELQELLKGVLAETGLNIDVRDADRNLLAAYLAVRRVVAERVLEPKDLLYLPVDLHGDERLSSLFDVVLDVDVAVHEPQYSGLSSDASQLEHEIRARCEAWLDVVGPTIAPLLSGVNLVFNCPR